MSVRIPTSASSLRQNAHLTFKHNLHQGRHGWLRLTPAYSVRLVTDILAGRESGTEVLDPFSGTGTTALCASYLGLCGSGLEINPFLVWFSGVKSRQFAAKTIGHTRKLAAEIAAIIASPSASMVEPPPIHNISRWWKSAELEFLCKLKAGIQDCAAPASDERDLLLVAFCRTLIKISNAAFNHQSMSFKEADTSPDLFGFSYNYCEDFIENLSFVLEGAADNPATSPCFLEGDARAPSHFLRGKYDVLITSPPYPNRISYIRELRPYMYWLEFLKNGREAGEYDWQAIGGTWGIATSRLADWSASADTYFPHSLRRIVAEIDSPKNMNGRVLSNYIVKYFGDIWRHIEDVRRVLNGHAEIHYIVGNSSFYETHLPVEAIYKDMLEKAGFRHVQIAKLRKRNSKAELFEFDVSGKMG